MLRFSSPSSGESGEGGGEKPFLFYNELLSPLTVPAVCLLSRGGGTGEWEVLTVAAQAIVSAGLSGSFHVCFTERTVSVQDLKRPIYLIYLCFCCGKMLQLCVFIGFICSCLTFGTRPILIPVWLGCSKLCLHIYNCLKCTSKRKGLDAV